MYCKRLSTSTEWDSFWFLKRQQTVQGTIGAVNEALEQGKGSLGTKALSEVPSQHQGNRYAYLVKNVCERYYAQNQGFVDSYFGNGANGQSNFEIA